MIGATVDITGIDQIDSRLNELGTKSLVRIGMAVSRRMVARYARSIRRFVPKSIAPKVSDKGIGHAVKKSSDGRTFIAKAGIGVGRAQKNALNAVNRGRRKGVGVTAKNLHWFALGTSDRYTGGRSRSRPRRFTGKIDKRKWGGFVELGVMSSETQAVAAGQQALDRLLPQEIERLKSVQ